MRVCLCVLMLCLTNTPLNYPLFFGRCRETTFGNGTTFSPRSRRVSVRLGKRESAGLAQAACPRHIPVLRSAGFEALLLKPPAGRDGKRSGGGNFHNIHSRVGSVPCFRRETPRVGWIVWLLFLFVRVDDDKKDPGRGVSTAVDM